MAYSTTTAFYKITALKKRVRAIAGGTSASKTISILLYLISYAQIDKTPTITSIVSESFPHLKKGAMRDFLQILETHGIYDDNAWNRTDFTYTFPNRSKIEFFSVDEAGKVRGPRRDRLFINEVNNISFETYEQLEVRTKDFILMDWNPSSEFFFYTELKGKDFVDFITLTYKDNEALDPNIVASIESRKSRKDWWQVYGLGQLGELEGKIYSDWKIIDEIPHEARLERYGLDFGFNPDPAVIIAVYYYNGGYIFDEIVYQQNMHNREIAGVLKNLLVRPVIADSAEPKSISEIRSYGITILPAKKGKDSIRSGITMMQEQKISMTKNSVNLIREYRGYLWKQDRDGRIIAGVPESGQDHALDAARYAMSSLIPAIQRKELLAQMPLWTKPKKANPAR